ncbi:MAG: chromate transporter [Paludibacteraceae bacterium]|nr:chromate transporter [Paludibacteraceae bacterium]
MIYLQLIFVFIKVGLLGFGGGMAIISLIQGEVLSRGWMTETEFVDIVGISQVTPGPIGINCATYVGYTVGGIWGSLLASMAIILPSLVIMLSVCYAYDKIKDKYQDNRVFQTCMRIIRILVVILVAHAAITLVTPTTFIDWKSWTIFGFVFVAMLLPEIPNLKSKIIHLLGNPILLILAAGVAGYLLYFF